MNMIGKSMSRICMLVVAMALFSLTGCATLTITPQQSIKKSTGKLPYKIGIQTSGDRIRALLSDPNESVAIAASGTLFDKVILLPGKARFQQPSEIATEHGVDYILETQIADFHADGNLNPIWFVSFPLLFFKPFTPIVTFETSVSLNATLVDARSGEILMQKEVVEMATDFYSPVNPEEKVKKLVGLTINNALVALFNDLPGAIAAKKK